LKLNFHKSGSTGLIVTVIGGVMLAATFFVAFDVYTVYFALAKNNFNSTSADFVPSLNSLVQAAIVVMFLGIMGGLDLHFY
jgi:hypothetical protein